jgi:hypothetical protein
MSYRSFKYWQTSKNDALALAVVVTFGMYEECLLEEDAQDYWHFEEEDNSRQRGRYYRFTIQALSYSSINQFYPGDKNFREVTQMSKARRE